jgi:hypothetical protein
MTKDNAPYFCETSRCDLPLTIAAAIWAVCYLGSLLLLKHEMVDGWLKIAVVLIPVIPFAVFLTRFVSQLRRLDELQRRVHLEALGYVFPLAILFFMTLGLLEVAKILSSKYFSYQQVWFYLPVFYAIGLVLSWRRYR